MKKIKKSSLYKTLFLLVTFLFSLGLTQKNNPRGLVIQHGNIYYLANTVVVKFRASIPPGKDQSAGMFKQPDFTSQLNAALGKYKFYSTQSIFGEKSSGANIGMNRIYTVKYDDNADPAVVASKIKHLNGVEWAEPKFLRKPAVIPKNISITPNDQYYSQQYNLAKIDAAAAWNISTGSPNIIIGIVDTGVDWSHPDLYGNIWHNPNWQNDTNFLGDSIGWDFGGNGDANLNPTPDNNPMEDVPAHGTFVAGIASAVTNNGIGVAGIGYNCKIMAVKVSQGNITSNKEPLIVYGFEGIKYAVDHGAKVINCSWGGGGYSEAEQETINYAISKGALVVAAAGNDNSNELFYPASYKGVLSVGATDETDTKSFYSNYGPNIDVMAPGDNITSTWQPDTYLTPGSGTSFASPLAAGLAGLAFSVFPNYSPLQIAQQIRVNTDNIDTQNGGYYHQLGSGRINAFKTLADTNSQAIRADDIQFFDNAPGDNNNGVLEPGETISIGIKFKNYLKPVNGVTVTLQSFNSYSTVVNSSFTITQMGTLDTIDNSSATFTVKLDSTLPENYKLQFNLNFSGGSYKDFQMFDMLVNPSYATQSGGNVALTITSKGASGFNDYPTNIEGDGFSFQGGGSLMFEGALMLGTSAKQISDEARDSIAQGQNQDTAFTNVQPLSLLTSNSGYREGTTIFNDNGALNKLGVTIKLRSYTFINPPDNDYIILRYSIINNNNTNISNLYTGVFFDWDLTSGGDSDYTAYDTAGNLGYANHTNSSQNKWVATALISSNNYGYWGILNSGGDGGFQIYDGFSFSEKWQALSSRIGKPKAGPGDISEVTSGGPFNISAHDTIDVAFAVAGGYNINDLRTAVEKARLKYRSILTGINNDNNNVPLTFNLSQNYPNPFNPSTTINFQLAKSGHVSLKVYDILGNQVADLVEEDKPAGNYSVQFFAGSKRLSSGIYFYRLVTPGFVDTKKMVYLK
ncbi:MAG: S8 family serine peptidase [Ignavibacteriaceae bacterium]